MSKRRALVIGGSLGGLIVAHLLRSDGWDAIVFERNEPDLASRGVGIGTHPQLIASCNASASRSTTPWGSAYPLHLPRARRQDHRRTPMVPHHELVVAASIGRCTMRCRTDYQRGQSAGPVKQDADGVTAIFGDGTRERTMSWSVPTASAPRCARNIGRSRSLVYAGYVAWRARWLDERLVPRDMLARDFRAATRCCLPPGEQSCSAYPVPGQR